MAKSTPVDSLKKETSSLQVAQTAILLSDILDSKIKRVRKWRVSDFVNQDTEWTKELLLRPLNT